MKIKLSQKQWELIGKKAGWIPRDPTDISDQDLGPIMTPDEEEDVLLGPEETMSPEERLAKAENEGYEYGKQHSDTVGCPYGSHSEFATALCKKWFEGHLRARRELGKI
jgi:hypothetical protein